MNKKYLALLDEGWEHTASAFDGLGLEDAEGLQAKAYLRAAILSRIATLAITQREAARRIGVPQPKVSNLMSDTARKGFSSDKLMEFATKLGLDIKIQVTTSRSDVGRVTVTGAAAKKLSQKKANPRRTGKRRKIAKAA
ncbi:MAG: helix-turn-helix domain-containing protein [Candidatus Eremiobacteraeota bacterium]|nr:helix-turn-helix domain-containing protein [Candidatus Eremiobacteraeota bacterium]